MSNLAIAAAHFVAIPARYAVGRWSNIPTNTLLAFNVTELGLYIIIRSIWNYAADYHNKVIPQKLIYYAVWVIRILMCLTAVYVTSRVTEPMPLNTAALTNLAAAVSVYVAVEIAEWAKGKK